MQSRGNIVPMESVTFLTLGRTTPTILSTCVILMIFLTQKYLQIRHVMVKFIAVKVNYCNIRSMGDNRNIKIFYFNL